jgi:hypothetical protein
MITTDIGILSKIVLSVQIATQLLKEANHVHTVLFHGIQTRIVLYVSATPMRDTGPEMIAAHVRPTFSQVPLTLATL